MSLLSTLGTVGGILGGVGGFLSPFLGYSATQRANRMQFASAREQMQFQKMMSDTSYQRAVKDMRAAGINPMLAVSKGGASTPSGAQAQVKDPGPTLASSALGLRRLQEDLKNLEAQRELTEAQTITEHNKPENILAQTRNYQTLTKKALADIRYITQNTHNLELTAKNIGQTFNLNALEIQRLQHQMHKHRQEGIWWNNDRQVWLDVMHAKQMSGTNPWEFLKDIGWGAAAVYGLKKAFETTPAGRARSLILESTKGKRRYIDNAWKFIKNKIPFMK